ALSQVYHELNSGKTAGYAKFETFPVWNLPLEHPVNLAYEAATVDLNDANVIDHFHLKAHGESAVNYNRDVEAFPLLSALLEKMTGHVPYQSPTDMGVNMVGFCITDDKVCRKASEQEIIRRYFKTLVDEARAGLDDVWSSRAAVVMAKAGIKATDRRVVMPARLRAEETKDAASAMELADATIIRGRTSELLGGSAAMLVDEARAGLDDVWSSRAAVVMAKAGIKATDRRVVMPARLRAEETKDAASAMELADGTIIRGRTSELLGCSAAMLLNALKHLAG